MTFRRGLSIGTAIAASALIGWALLSNVSDADTWWHIKAGQVMLETGKMISIDPFAHTRAGLPYLATHEWLYQVVTALLYMAGGATLLIWVRMAVGVLTAAILVNIDRKNVFPNALLAAAAMLVMRQDFVERPQLFSILLFAVCLTFCLRLLELPHDRRRNTLIGLFAITILWANIHGGGAILSPLLLGTVLAQELLASWRLRRLGRPDVVLAGSCIALFLALLITPNGLGNITYLRLLFTDDTSALLREWKPTPIGAYLTWIGPFGVIALASIAAGRRNVIATTLMLLGLGALSRSASRHDVLFVITALGVTFYQLKHSHAWQNALEKLREKKVITGAIAVASVLFLLLLDRPYQKFLQRRDLAGFGAFSPITGAADFLEANDARGPLFNTYTAGGYLLFRNQKVFVDGRNVDYGYAFLKPALDARMDASAMQSLLATYKIETLVIERHTQDGATDTDFAFLPLPGWILVYLDDWTTVYVRDVSENVALIAAHQYRFLTPAILDAGTLPETLSEADVTRFAKEVERASAEDPQGIRSLILLSKLHRATGNFDAAIATATRALERSPSRFEPEEILGSIAAAQEKWTETTSHYERALDLSDHLKRTPPYAQLAMIFEKAGLSKKAEEFRRKAKIQ